MTDLYSEDEVVTRVTRLTRARLVSFVEARVVTPVRSDTGWVYRELDIVRLELLCDLVEEFELEDDALALVISLVDQLHGVRAELRAVVDAVAREPAEVGERVRAAVRATRTRR